MEAIIQTEAYRADRFAKALIEQRDREKANEPQEQTRHCNKCGRDLPLTSFSICRSREDGYQSYCKECQKKLSRISYEKKIEKEKQKEEQLKAAQGALANYQPRELFAELTRRGYHGEAEYVQKIKF
jgi:hypothetical protein